ncbi:MAG: shikimate kinase [Nitrospirota bacterium]|nr:shikimate kinase [Nitrospirota bacterium]
MNVILTGFMGTGKSTVGRRLAQRLGQTFVDLDSIIENEAGMTINEIFASQGEGAFRDKESGVVEGLVNGSYGTDLVVATGGGAIIRESNRIGLKGWGAVICLKTTPDEVLRRVGRAGSRPLLESDDKLQKIARMMEERDPYYADCDLLIDTTDKRADEVLEIIMQFLGTFRASR